MDRRQRKTREAILSAFSQLLEKRSYHHITVQDIIDKADVGRATFYAHFAAKDDLLQTLCDELFGHIIRTADELPDGQTSAGTDGCQFASASIFLHLLRHLAQNHYNICTLLSSTNSEIFLPYFKNSLKTLIQNRYAASFALSYPQLPKDYLVNHVASSFVETVGWWLRGGMRETPEEVAQYFEVVTAGLG